MTKPVTRKMAVYCLLWLGEKDLTSDSVPNIACYICGKAVKAGQDIQFDHVHALVHNGPHEYENLRPVHAQCHKIKTAADVKANAKMKRLANPKPSKRPMPKSSRVIPSRPFPRRVKS